MERSTSSAIIADDHPIVRAGIVSVLQTHSRLRILGEAQSFEDLYAQLLQQAPDVLILDLNGMGLPPLTMVSKIRREFPNSRLIIFSSNVDAAPELLELGVVGYLAKEDLGTHLLAAIDDVLQGRHYLSAAVADYVDRVSNAREQWQLTASETHVLVLLAQGYGTTETAEIMHIDPRSVQNYITRLRRKTGCTERTQLVDWYRRMIDPR